MTKALVAVNDVTVGGVYYSANIDFTDLTTQPTWTKLATTGLANLNVKVMRNDPFTPYDDIYLQLDNDNVYRWDDPVWTKIMDLATARTLSGLAAGVVGHIAINQTVAGVIYLGIQIVTTLHLLKSVDYGANWTDATVTNDIMTGLPYIAASGNYIDICTGEIYRMAYMSSNNGAAWTWQGLWNNSGGGAPIRIDPHDPQYFYYRMDSSDADLSKVKVGTITELQNGYSLTAIDTFEHQMWIDPITANHHRIIRSLSNNVAIFSTTDGWATFVDSTPTNLKTGWSNAVGALMAARENTDYCMFGITAATTQGLVEGFVGDNPTQSFIIAGTNWNVPPYTNAIPWVGTAYVAFQGIFVGEAPSSRGVYVYSVETDAFDDDHIPMKGDRSAWETVQYPDEHAEDVQEDTPQIHGPWPMASGNIAVSDGSKLVETTPAAFGIHNPVTLAADADTLLGLSTQQLTLDSQTANRVFSGPTSGAAADPTFRALVALDLATGGDATKYLRGDMTWQPFDIILDYIHEHAVNEDLSGLCDGARQVFILANEYKPEATAIYLNGLRQLLITDYTEDAGYDQITMTTAPEAGDILTADYILAGAI